MSQQSDARHRFPEHSSLDLVAFAQEISQQWVAHIPALEDSEAKSKMYPFQAELEAEDGRETFVFYEGPPSANGQPGIHHVMGRTIKDLVCRFKTMQGFRVPRKSGWDTHGLPVELQVEKELGITKEDIGKKISVEEYNAKCRETVMRYTADWERLTEEMGYWVDMQHPYVTFDNAYIESVWSLLKALYDKGLLYKGYSIQPYSPMAGTGLSSHELNQPGTYRNVKDTTIVAMFELTTESRVKACELFGCEDDTTPISALAWTTTPWTLPANVALSVGPTIDYVLVDTFNPYTGDKSRVILAEALSGKYFKEEGNVENHPEMTYDANEKKAVLPWRILGTAKGKALQDLTYHQLLPYQQPEGEAFKIITADFVTTTDGTGIVHTAPAHGADDFKAAEAHGIGMLLMVDRRGRFVKEVTDFAGEPVKLEYYDYESKNSKHELDAKAEKSVDERIAIKLKLEGKAFKVEKYEHTYPHCWRTDTPILYYPLDSWFIRTTALKDELIARNKEISWFPESTGTGRFGHWLENLVDWNLSRSRYWGTPLPVWRNPDGSGETIVLGSLSEAIELEDYTVFEVTYKDTVLSYDDIKNTTLHLSNTQVGKSTEEVLAHIVGTGFVTVLTRERAQEIDHHSADINRIILIKNVEAQEGVLPVLLVREPDLIDVWFDSGAMPYAQEGYNFQSANGSSTNLPPNFPADFIAEGVDQTRGWFFTLHAISTLLFDSPAYKNVVSNGLVLDKNGQKMSKRLGNAVDPFQMLHQFGPDAVRWYMVGNASPWDNLKFDPKGITEVTRNFFATVYNTYGFLAMYANVDGFDAKTTPQIPVNERPELDRWILAALDTLVGEVTAALDVQAGDDQLKQFDPAVAVRAMERFVDKQLSNWYVRLSRRRFWKGDIEGSNAEANDKVSAYHTLHPCLSTLALLMAPIAPYYSDRLWQDLGATTSVHLAKFPTQEAERQDAALEARMAAAQTLASLTLSLRKKADLRVRQPLSRILVPVKNEAQQAELERVANIVLTETNIKTIEFIVGTKAMQGLVTKSAKANFKVLGARLGKRMKDVAAAVLLLSQDDIAVLEEREQFTLTLPDESTESIHLHEVEIQAEDLPGWQVASEGGLTVALDTSLTQALKNEGFARDLVNRIQRLRKESGYAITDRIALELESVPEVVETFTAFQAYIREEILAERLELIDRASLEAVDTQNETQRGDLHWLDVEEVQVGVRIQRMNFHQPS